jgi:hypothetical protein
MTCAAFVLILLGGLATLSGVALAAFGAWRRLRALDLELADLIAINNDTLLDQPTKRQRLADRSSREILGPWNEGGFIGHAAEREVVRDAVHALRGPAVLVAFGTITSTVGSLIALGT